MKLIRKNVRSRLLSRPIDQQIILRSAVHNAQQAFDHDPFPIIKHRTYVIESRSKSLSHTEMKTFQKTTRNQELNLNMQSIKRVFKLQDLKGEDVELMSKSKVNQQKEKEVEKSSTLGTTMGSYLEREKMRLQKEQEKKKELRSNKKQEMKKKWESQRRQRQFLQQINEAREDQNQRKNPNFFPLGLQNLGNTCYLNSILQCFINLPLFNQYFYGGKYLQDIEKTKTSSDLYAKLLFELQKPNNKNKSQSPEQLKQFLGTKNPRFSGNKQQDCTEFLTLLLSSMNKQLFKIDFNLELPTQQPQTILQLSEYYWIDHLKKQNSHITKYFCGQIISTISCSNCSSTFQKFDNFYDIQLSFSKEIQSLQDMFVQFTKPQHLIDYRCPICNQANKCQKQIQITKLPLILIIQLKRFKQTLRGFEKIKSQAILPFSINLSKFILQELLNNKIRVSSSYEFWGFSKHYGELNSGHYTTQSKNNINGKWFDFNDSKVTEIVRDKEGALKSKQAYVLFYINHFISWVSILYYNIATINNILIQ